jgi:hypothetical protein
LKATQEFSMWKWIKSWFRPASADFVPPKEEIKHVDPKPKSKTDKNKNAGITQG